MRNAIFLTASLLLAGCATTPATPPEATMDHGAMDHGAMDHGAMDHGGGQDMASAPLIAANGGTVGTVRFMPMGSDLHLVVEAAGLAPGRHGLHLHAAGRCDTPDFKSAAAHWNPTSRQHGHMNPAGPHLGDLGNLSVGADGRVSANFHAAGAGAYADADGTSLVIHAMADDEKTDPSGASGDRIACAVLSQPR